MNRKALTLTLIIAFSAALTHVAADQVPDSKPPATRPAGVAIDSPPAPENTPPPKPAEPPKEAVPEKLSVTTGQITINNQLLSYTATTGYMPQKDESGKLKANIFFVAYTRNEPATTTAQTQPQSNGGGWTAHRPIMFLFNGGPGAASVWLHLGTAGPKRIALNDNGDAPVPPFALEDNPQSWLDLADLVFIDPVGTGYSRPGQGEDPKAFFGVKEDLASVGEFIRTYTTKYQRWASPKYLAGESYGTTRAAALADVLADRYGISVNGVVLISSILNFQTIQPDFGNDLPFALYLPSYTAVAWYHKKLSPDLQADLDKTLHQSETFALGSYSTALTKGDALSPADLAATLDQLSKFTGLSKDYLSKSNLRIQPARFQHELLSDQRKVLGRFDARLTGPDMDTANDSAEYDPALPAFFSAYTAMFTDYARRTLKYDNDLSYETLSNRVHPWNFGPGGHGYLVVSDNLQHAMIKNPQLKVFVGSGYFDLATPYLATIYTFDHLNLPPDLQKNITRAFYQGGHMLYHPKSQQQKLKSDLTTFFNSAMPATSTAPHP